MDDHGGCTGIFFMDKTVTGLFQKVGDLIDLPFPLSVKNPFYIGVRISQRMCLAGIPKAGYETYVRPFVVCRACAEEEQRQWFDFKKTPEGQCECVFFDGCFILREPPKDRANGAL